MRLVALTLLLATLTLAGCSNSLAPTPTITVTYTIRVSEGASAEVSGVGVSPLTLQSGVWVREVSVSVYTDLTLTVTPHNGCAVVMWHVAGGRDYGYVKCS